MDACSESISVYNFSDHSHSSHSSQCFELERLVRPSRKDAKGKGKQKEPIHEYNETSLHDSVLRMQLLHGYEAFKVDFIMYLYFSLQSYPMLCIPLFLSRLYTAHLLLY